MLHKKCQNIAKKWSIGAFGRLLEIEDAFIALVHQQVEDAQVGKKTLLRTKDLVVSLGLELRVGQGMLGADGIAEVVDALGCTFFRGEVGGGGLYLWLDVEQLAHQCGDVVVEVDEELPPALEEGREVVGIELEEGRLTIGTADSIPVQVSPVAVVADAYVAGEPASGIVRHGYGECLYAVCGGDAASVAVSLFHKTVVLLHPHLSVSVEFLVPLHRSEIGGGEQALCEAPLRWLWRRGVAGYCRWMTVVCHVI